MEERYTFSRALHLMRYGAKNMRPIDSDLIYFCNSMGELRFRDVDGFVGYAILDSMTIMGSWVEVK